MLDRQKASFKTELDVNLLIMSSENEISDASQWTSIKLARRLTPATAFVPPRDTTGSCISDIFDGFQPNCVVLAVTQGNPLGTRYSGDTVWQGRDLL